MRYEKPEAEIWRQGPNKEDMYCQVERVGRICYASHSKSDGTLEKAKEFTKGDEFATTPAPLGGCWNRLINYFAKILLIFPKFRL